MENAEKFTEDRPGEVERGNLEVYRQYGHRMGEASVHYGEISFCRASI